MTEQTVTQDMESLLSGGTTTSPLAGLDQLSSLLPAILFLSVVATILISVFAVILVVYRVRSQKATVQMQKDIKAIRELLERVSAPPVDITPQTPVTPTPHNNDNQPSHDE